MVNNNFMLIGTFITNFETIKVSDDAKVYEAKIEVEKYKGSGADVIHIPVTFFSSCKHINFNIKPKGKLVALSGHIDVNITQKGVTFNKLIGDAIKILNNDAYGKKEFQNQDGNFTETEQEIY